LELEKAAKHGAQRGVKIKKMWDPADGYSFLGADRQSVRELAAVEADDEGVAGER
jgi:hypothetical protein